MLRCFFISERREQSGVLNAGMKTLLASAANKACGLLYFAASGALKPIIG